MRPSLLVAWVLRIILATAFLYFGITKFADAGYASQFVVWGYPAGFQYITGVIEVVGAVLLVIPATTIIGVALLAATMVAAILTVLFAGGGAVVLVPLSLLVALVALGWLRWRDHV